MHALCTLILANQKLCSDPFSLELTLLGQQSTQLAFPFPAGTEERAPSNPGFWFTGDRQVGVSVVRVLEELAIESIREEIIWSSCAS